MKIGFIGGINAFNIPYALKLKEDGFDVKFISSSQRDDFLNRPEHQFPRKIQYPYPSWVCENLINDTLFTRAFPEFFHKKTISFMKDRDIIFLNDYGLSLSKYLPQSATLIALCSGSDLDVMCNYKAAWYNSLNIKKKWTWPISLILHLRWTFLQRCGLNSVSCISYFPPGLNKVGDNIIEKAIRIKPSTKFIPRYDVDFDSANIKFTGASLGSVKKVLVPVRFCLNPGRGNSFEYKGNDKIIEGLGKYIKRNNNLEIIFFLKGSTEELDLAKSLCKMHGIENNVKWLPSLPLNKLLELYYESDVIIDQVGNHWMGAVGAYGMYAGKVVITNWRPDVFENFYSESFPALQATTSDEIFNHLIRCESFEFRRNIGELANKFVKENLNVSKTYEKYKNYLLNLSF